MMIAVNYEDEFNPHTYHAIEIHEDGDVLVFDSGDMIQDINNALNSLGERGGSYHISSSFDNLLMDTSGLFLDLFVDEVYALRCYLTVLHEVYQHPWREIVSMDEFKDSGVSFATLHDIANGREPSAETCRKLGIKKTDIHRRAAYFGKGEEAKELAEEWDEVSEQWGGMTGLARGILEGRYKITEDQK